MKFIITILEVPKTGEDIISGGPGEVPVGKSVSRAVASMYSWGGGGGRPKISE
jgi:hypothetical protein